MRISDWSSDVCASELHRRIVGAAKGGGGVLIAGVTAVDHMLERLDAARRFAARNICLGRGRLLLAVLFPIAARDRSGQQQGEDRDFRIWDAADDGFSG